MSTKYKKLLIIVSLLSIFVALSAFRYYQVNKPFETYFVDEKIVLESETFRAGGLIFSYGPPMIEEREDHFHYEIPLHIANDTNDHHYFYFERFYLFSDLMYNRLALEDFLNHPMNENFTPEGIAPNSTEDYILTFNLYKNWKVTEDSEIILYYKDDVDGGVIKYAYHIKK